MTEMPEGVKAQALQLGAKGVEDVHGLVAAENFNQRKGARELERRLALFPGISPRRVIHEFGPWLHYSFTATPAAAEHLREWSALGGPETEASELCGGGDVAILHQARRVLAILPTPTRWQVVAHFYIVGVGVKTVGWCDTVPSFFQARILALSTDSHDLIRHEFSHAWLHGSDALPRDSLMIAKREQLRDAPQKVAALWNMNHKLEEHRAHIAATEEQQEREAIALADSWRRNFPVPPEEEESCDSKLEHSRYRVI